MRLPAAYRAHRGAGITAPRMTLRNSRRIAVPSGRKMSCAAIIPLSVRKGRPDFANGQVSLGRSG